MCTCVVHWDTYFWGECDRMRPGIGKLWVEDLPLWPNIPIILSERSGSVCMRTLEDEPWVDGEALLYFMSDYNIIMCICCDWETWLLKEMTQREQPNTSFFLSLFYLRFRVVFPTLISRLVQLCVFVLLKGSTYDVRLVFYIKDIK